MTGEEDEEGPAGGNQMGKKLKPIVLEAEGDIMWLEHKKGEGKAP